jgi:hypothetical protein
MIMMLPLPLLPVARQLFFGDHFSHGIPNQRLVNVSVPSDESLLKARVTTQWVIQETFEGSCEGAVILEDAVTFVGLLQIILEFFPVPCDHLIFGFFLLSSHFTNL